MARGDHRVGFIISVDDDVVRDLGERSEESNEALAISLGALHTAVNTATGSVFSILTRIPDLEVAVAGKVGVLSGGASAGLVLEGHTHGVDLFIPGTHVEGSVKVGEGRRAIAEGNVVHRLDFMVELFTYQNNLFL